MRRPSTRRFLAPTILAALAFAGCAVPEEPDGWSTDTHHTDASDVRADAIVDAHDGITPIDTGNPDTGNPDTGGGVDVVTDTGSMPDVRDTGTDTGSVVDVVTDTGGGGLCPAACTANAECQNMCPAASAGYVYCCLTGSGGGCYQYMGSACPAGGTDGGTTGSDSGIPLGGGPNSVCSDNAQCNSGANCCAIIGGGVGFCGCSVPIFGCLPC